jgi:hypothetical protein
MTHEELETCLKIVRFITDEKVIAKNYYEVLDHDKEQRKEIETLKQGLERACEWHENTCPINELSLTGPYPEWCQFVADAEGEPQNCRHWQGSPECWMRYYLEGMDDMV